MLTKRFKISKFLNLTFIHYPFVVVDGYAVVVLVVVLFERSHMIKELHSRFIEICMCE